MNKAVWLEAWKLTQRLEEITGVMKSEIEAGEVEALHSLIGERQKIFNQLDQLRKRAGIRSWTDVENEGVSQEIQIVSQKIVAAFKNLLKEDQMIKNILEEKRTTVLKKLEQVRRSRQAHETYEGSGIFGGFIDSRC
jgi:flagellar biosynthesis/type III secretory pathway chaperone